MEKSFPLVPWARATNVYEVNTRQYTPEGTFAAFNQSLPRLRSMGVDTLWFMPITPIGRQGRLGSLGSYYACSDYTSVNPEFGTLEDFRSLVAQAHALGMKVIIDWVANHTGQDHHWTRSNPEYYKRDSEGRFYDAHGWMDVFDLEYSCLSMRAAMIESMAFWVRTCGIDGFRCDMAMLVTVDFWREARTALDEIRPLFWMAELDQVDNPEYLEVFDAAYTWKWMHATQEFYAGRQSLGDLVKLLRAYDLPGSRLFFTSNHDENSWNGTEYEKYGDMAPSLAVFSCTWNGIPMVYSGQELPNRKRLKFFDRDPIEWGVGKPALQDFYSLLLGLHSRNPALRADDPAVTTYLLGTGMGDQVLAFVRRTGDSAVLVLLNWSTSAATFGLSDDWATGAFKDVFTGEALTVGRDTQWTLPPWGYRVLQRR